MVTGVKNANRTASFWELKMWSSKFAGWPHGKEGKSNVCGVDPVTSTPIVSGCCIVSIRSRDKPARIDLEKLHCE